MSNLSDYYDLIQHLQPQEEFNQQGFITTLNDQNEHQVVDISSVIQSTARVLELTATKLNPKLKRRGNMSLREYIYFLMKHLSLDKSICNSYVETYELARFSNITLSKSQYQSFTELFHVLLQSITNNKRQNIS